MRISANNVQPTGPPARTALMRSPALARSSTVLFWILLLLAGLATGFLLAQSVRYLLGS